MLGLGGARRHRRVLRDNIQGLAKGQIKRLIYKAGGFRSSGLIYEETRGITKIYLEKLLRQVVTITEHRRLKTISSNSVLFCLQPRMFSEFIPKGKCRIYGSKKDKEEKEKKKEEEEGDEEEEPEEPEEAEKKDEPQGELKVEEQVKKIKKRREKGVDKIRHYQRTGDCVFFPKVSFERLVREVAQDYKNDLRFSSDAKFLIQFATEAYLVKLYEDALLVMFNAKRQTLMPKDLQAARRVRKERY